MIKIRIKPILKFLSVVMMLKLAPMARAATPYSHPLGSVLKSLNQTSAEIAVVANSTDPEIKKEAERLKDRVADLSVDAIVVPVKITNRKLSALGLDIQLTSNIIPQYEAVENSTFSALEKEARNMNGRRWISLENQIEAALREADGIGRLLNEEYKTTLPTTYLDKAAETVNLSRNTVLKNYAERARDMIDCVAYFTDAADKSGLRTLVEHGSYRWDNEALIKKFGVEDLTDLSSTKKIAVAAELKEMLVKAVEYHQSCMPIEGMRFINEQRKSLEK